MRIARAGPFGSAFGWGANLLLAGAIDFNNKTLFEEVTRPLSTSISRRKFLPRIGFCYESLPVEFSPQLAITNTSLNTFKANRIQITSSCYSGMPSVT
jgi:hypothetical protein